MDCCPCGHHVIYQEDSEFWDVGAPSSVDGEGTLYIALSFLCGAHFHLWSGMAGAPEEVWGIGESCVVMERAGQFGGLIELPPGQAAPVHRDRNENVRVLKKSFSCLAHPLSGKGGFFGAVVIFEVVDETASCA